MQVGVAQNWQCDGFWSALHDAHDWAHTEAVGHQHRVTSLMGFLDTWYLTLGIERPSLMTRGRWARRYAGDVDMGSGTPQHPCMCNRYQPGERQRIEDHFNAKRLREYNEGPPTVHPKDPGWVVRLKEGTMVLEQMTWGFPVVLRGKQGQPLKPKPVNNARFDKLGAFWKRWAAQPEHRCLIPTARYAEAVGTPGKMTETWLSLKDQPLFAWAGLCRASDEWGDCYTGVMTENAPELSHIHDRSPVILLPDQWQAWLTNPLAELYQFDRPFPAAGVKIDATAALWARR
ncbi:SOS response-associated peptidase [Blastomonas fulva]|uniref:SOS response-associated peptidase n=1 Tax=Blastomonas fulva TaxID=1550728 RepID=UPI003F6EF0D1